MITVLSALVTADGGPGIPKAGAMAVSTGMQPKQSDALIILAYIALGLAFVASFMPWATVLVFTVSGTQGDGVLTLILALVGAMFLLGWHINTAHSKWLLICALIATTLVGIVFWYDMIDITRVAHNAGNTSGNLFHISVSPGSGLYLGCIASIAAVILEVLLLLRQPALAVQVAQGPMSSVLSPTAPSGWHTDPTRRHELRYFNGAAWTEHVSDRGAQAIDPLA